MTGKDLRRTHPCSTQLQSYETALLTYLRSLHVQGLTLFKVELL